MTERKRRMPLDLRLEVPESSRAHGGVYEGYPQELHCSIVNPDGSVDRISPDANGWLNNPRSSVPLARTPDPVKLVLPYPPSANRMWAHRIVKSKATGKMMALTYETSEAKSYKAAVQVLAIRAGVKPQKGKMIVLLELYPHQPQDHAKRKRLDPGNWEMTVQCMDLGNCEKVIGDALNGIAWDDDKQLFAMLKLRRPPDEHGERCVVTFCPMPQMLDVHGAFEPNTFLQGELL